MRMKNAAREAKVAEPVFDLTEFFKVTFKRSDVQSVANRSPIGQSILLQPIKNKLLSPTLKNTVKQELLN